MTRETLRRRVERLEEFAARLDKPGFVIMFRFVSRGGSPEEATVAKGPHGFKWYREADESLFDFEARAVAAARGLQEYGKPPVIVIFANEDYPYAA
jgi:hypothetical protein